jgi:hypothetical protein
MATQSYVIRSTDAGISWSTPQAGNLTNTVPEMLQWGEGGGILIPGTGRLVMCGWSVSRTTSYG